MRGIHHHHAFNFLVAKHRRLIVDLLCSEFQKNWSGLSSVTIFRRLMMEYGVNAPLWLLSVDLLDVVIFYCWLLPVRCWVVIVVDCWLLNSVRWLLIVDFGCSILLLILSSALAFGMASSKGSMQ
jgi:hypothetical protein